MTTTLSHSSRLRTVGLWWLALTAVAIAVFGPLRYLTDSLPSLAADGDPLGGNYAGRPSWAHLAFYAHVAFGGLALLLSPVQLYARVRARAPRLHRGVAGSFWCASAAAPRGTWCWRP